MGLILKKHGYICEKNWIYNDELEERKCEYNVLTPGFLVKFDNYYPFSLLCFNIELENNYTVRDWFELVIRYPIFQKLDPFMNSYIEEYSQCPRKDCIDPDDNVCAICIKKMISLSKDHSKNLLYDCEIFYDIYGEDKDKNKDVNWGIDFWELKNYLDIPMKLSNGVYTKEIPKTYENISEEVKLDYTLYEFITSFIYEISFYGTPEKRNKKSKELKQSCDDIIDRKN